MMKDDDSFTVGSMQEPHLHRCIVLVTCNKTIGLRVLE